MYVRRLLPSLVDGRLLMVDGGPADMRALLTVVVYVEGGVIPDDEEELAAAVDVGIVPYNAFICGERVMRFGDVVYAKQTRCDSVSLSEERANSRAGFV